MVVCGGSISDYSYMQKYFEDVDLIISVDSGARHIRNFGVIPDVLMGDFDSISFEDKKFFEDKAVRVLNYPPEKDMTDSELAIELAVEKGCKDIIILGAAGTRLDHTLANVFLLRKLLDVGVRGLLADEHNEIQLIDKSIEIEKEEGVKVSLLPLCGEVKGVTTKGLYYPLENAALNFSTNLGVSNEFIDDKASVTITEGFLLVIKAKD